MVVVTLNRPVLMRERPVLRLPRLRSDEQLLELFRQGDDEAFSALFERHQDKLLRYVRRLLGGAGAEAEDVLQDVFIRGYRTLRNDHRDIPVKAWFYRVAHNRAIDHLRRPAPAAADIFQLNRGIEADPFAETERRDRVRRLVRDVQGLPEHQRAALLLRELEGLSYAEVAATMDLSVGAVKSLLVRARVGLQEAETAESAACGEIRTAIDTASRQGVRVSGLARRHMLTCRSCRDHHARVRGTERAIAALDGGSMPWLAKLLGLGSIGGGAAAAGGVSTAAMYGGFSGIGALATKAVAVLATTGAIGVHADAGGHAGHRPATKNEVHALDTAVIRAPLTLVRSAERVAVKSAPAEPVRTQVSVQATTTTTGVTPIAAPPGDPETSISVDEPVSGGSAAPADLAETAEQTTPRLDGGTDAGASQLPPATGSQPTAAPAPAPAGATPSAAPPSAAPDPGVLAPEVAATRQVQPNPRGEGDPDRTAFA